MPIVERPRNGIYFDDCHPQYRVKLWWHAAALLVAILLWIVLIFAAVAIYRYVRGGA